MSDTNTQAKKQHKKKTPPKSRKHALKRNDGNSAQMRGATMVTLKELAGDNPTSQKVLNSFLDDPNPVALEVVDRLLTEKLLSFADEFSPHQLTSLTDAIGRNRERMMKEDAASVQHQVEQQVRDWIKRFMQKWNLLLARYLEPDQVISLLQEAAGVAQDITDADRDALNGRSKPRQRQPATVIDVPVARSIPGGNNKVAPKEKTEARREQPLVAPKDASTGLPPEK